jgi:hypothetical protein
MDQVPLPFIVNMDSTYTTDDDKDRQVAGTGKADLRKRQFTKHIYMNAAEGDKRDGYVELICKGKTLLGGRFSRAEREAWNKEVVMYFQKSAWMDREVMKESASRFCKHVAEKHHGKKVLLTCDNLDAQVCDEVKEIFAEGNIFLFCLPPSVTEAIQAIDAGYGRSMRAAIGRLLDDWLMNEDNMNKWEEGMNAGERRILISNMVAMANKEVLQNDEMRVGCFTRTGMLLTLDGSDDDKIKPQGCTQLPIQVPVVSNFTQEPITPEEVMTPEEQDGLITAEDEAIHFGDEEISEEIDVVAEDDDDEEEEDGSEDDDKECSEESGEEGSKAGEEKEAGDNEDGDKQPLRTRSGHSIRAKKRFAVEDFAFY